MKPFHAYMLCCKDGKYYVGHTDDLEKRIWEHQLGTYGGFTSRRLPVELVWCEDFSTREEALESELRIKAWSRAKKEALIRADWAGLKRAAKGKHQHERNRAGPSTPGPLRGPYARDER